MTDKEKLERLAVLERSIAFRLYEIQTWDARDKKGQKDDCIERDVILASVDSCYLHRMMLSRVRGERREAMPVRWRLRLVAWLASYL